MDLISLKVSVFLSQLLFVTNSSNSSQLIVWSDKLLSVSLFLPYPNSYGNFSLESLSLESLNFFFYFLKELLSDFSVF